MKKISIAVSILFVFITGLAVLSLFILNDYIYSPNDLNKNTTVILSKGSSLNQITDLLVENGIISKPRLFAIYSIIKKQNRQLKAGEYLFLPHATPNDVIQQIAKGDIVVHKMTIVEGTTTKDIIKSLKNNKLLSGEIATKPEDGVLFPSTYCYTYNDSRELILKNILNEMKSKIDKLWNERSPKVKLKSHKEAVILASIVEKEAANDQEKPLVAAVFHNRLQKKIRLQADPTITYALMKDYKIDRRILTKADLDLDTPYNTYKYRGLPPTPICNPGAKSMHAALHPADTDYLFFVSDGNGGHIFSKNYKEHAQNHNNLRKLRKELSEEQK